MDLQDLTRAMHNFVRSMGWYADNSPRPQTLRNLAVSLNLEAAEVLEHFQWQDSLVDQDALAGELADVALYLLQLASLSGIDLEQAILAKLKVNYQRTWDGANKTKLDSNTSTSPEQDSPSNPPQNGVT